MKNKSIIVLIFIISCLFTNCEKRIPIDADFPYETDRLFCEIIGITELGFYGQINLINEVQSSSSLSTNYHLTIEEDGISVIDTTSNSTVFFLAYSILPDKTYNLNIKYKQQTIYSTQVQTPAKILLKNLTATNDYIDSLGFNVVTYSFDATPTNASSDQYFSYTAQLVPDSNTALNLFKVEEGVRLDNSSPTHTQQRIPNFANYAFLKTGLLSLDQVLYQYLKNIKKLGNIPNDDIAGHHGNLTGGIGYFGIINYDLKQVAF